MGIGNHEQPNKGATDIWLTPIEFIEKLGTFDLDPCGLKNHATAKHIISFPDDGLAQAWFGRVWLNPPYSEVSVWMDRLIDHGNGVALVFARTDTKWAQRAMKAATSIFFPSKRITFLKADKTKPSGSAGAPSMFLSYGPVPKWPFEGIEVRKA